MRSFPAENLGVGDEMNGEQRGVVCNYESFGKTRLNEGWIALFILFSALSPQLLQTRRLARNNDDPLIPIQHSAQIFHKLFEPAAKAFIMGERGGDSSGFFFFFSSPPPR